MSNMAAADRKPLEDYLALESPFDVIADPEGGYVIKFPDLPGCLTQVDDIAEVGPMADEIRQLWIETAYETGCAIPLPSVPEEYSGKFVVRIPKSLHRVLSEGARRDGVSLNQYVVALLARNDAQAQVERRLEGLEAQLEAIAPKRTMAAEEAVFAVDDISSIKSKV